MKNFINLLLHFKIKAILFDETNDTFLQSIRYLFVGGIATIADWGALFVLEHLGINVYIATAIAFIIGLIVNFFLSKLFVFKSAESKIKSKFGEFIGYAAIGIVGLGITELLMYLFANLISLHFMIAKIIATIIVLAWNFIGRKYILYKN